MRPRTAVTTRIRVVAGLLLLAASAGSAPHAAAAQETAVVSTHPEFGATFVGASDGCVTGAGVRGLSPEGWYGRLDPTSARPVQLLLDGRPREAASSPLYFAERLPLAQVHWGLEDTSVPAVNGRDFVARYRKAGRPERCLDVHLHPDAGHDQDRQLAPARSRAFLLEAFEMSSGQVAACRPRPPSAVTARHPPVGADLSDAEEIRRVVTSAYIDGLHRNGSRDSIRAGFHPSFVMQVLGGDSISSVSIEQWIARLPDPGTPPDHTVTHRIPDVSVSGRAAVARVEVMFDDRHVFTDYMSLYEFEDGWRIVAKIFNAEER